MKLIHYIEPGLSGNSYWWEDSERVPCSPIFHTKFEAEIWHRGQYASFEAWQASNKDWLTREQEQN